MSRLNQTNHLLIHTHALLEQLKSPFSLYRLIIPVINQLAERYFFSSFCQKHQFSLYYMSMATSILALTSSFSTSGLVGILFRGDSGGVGKENGVSSL